MTMNKMMDHPTDFVPVNIEVEQALLGAVLLNNDVYNQTAEIVSSEYFAEPLHSRLWEMLGDRIGRGEYVSPVTLGAALGDAATTYLQGVTAAKYLARLASEATSVLGAPDYAKTIRELWTRRRLISLAREMADRAAGTFEDVGIEQILEQADQELSSIRFGKSVDGVSKLGDFAEQAVALTAQAYQSDVKIGFDTGIAAVDEIIGCMMPGDLVTILAPSGGGKSAMAAQILLRNCQATLDANRELAPGFFVSLEMTGAQIARRKMAARTGISTLKQRTGDINPAEYEFLRDAANRMKELAFYVDESGRQTTDSIIRKLRAMKRRHGIKIAVIDHVLLIKEAHRKMNKFETIEDAAVRLKDAAKELDMAIFLLAQITRESQKRDASWKVRASDLWGGERVRECSDIVMTVVQPSQWLAERKPDEDNQKAYGDWSKQTMRWEGKAEIGFPKMRDGESGKSCIVKFDGPRTEFVDA